MIFGLLLLMLGGLGFLLLRGRAPYSTPAPVAFGMDGGGADASVAAAPVDAGPVAKMDRALKVTALGWDLLAAGVVENGGSTPGPLSGFTSRGVDVQLSTADSVERLEGKLAAGGSEAEGADIAVLPLPVWVASYERLRALEPEVLLVTGWSHGREGLTGHASSLIPPPAASEDVKLVSAAADASTMLALFTLDLEGVGAGRVRLMKPSSDDAHLAGFAAVDRSHAGTSLEGRHLLLTTADAPRLVPIVAVAPHGLVQAHGPALAAWAEGWLHGEEKLRENVPEAARKVAAIQGAPEAVVLLVALGQLEAATLRDNAQLMGLSGRGAVTLERLFQSEWQLWRAAGVLSTPAPEHAPLATGIVTSLVRENPSLAEVAASPGAPPPADAASKPPKKGSVLVAHTEPPGKLDEEKLVADIGWMAGIFGGSTVRVSAPGKVAARAATTACDRFGLPTSRVVTGQTALGSASAVVEVLAAP